MKKRIAPVIFGLGGTVLVIAFIVLPPYPTIALTLGILAALGFVLDYILMTQKGKGGDNNEIGRRT